MKKFTLAFAAALMLCPLAMTGCGGHSGGVIEKDESAPEGGMAPEDAKAYEEAMNNRGGNRPGN